MMWEFANSHPYVFAGLCILVLLTLEASMANVYKFAAGMWNDLREERMRKQGTLPVEDVKRKETDTVKCRHAVTHTEGSLGEFCSDCNRPV
jgi:hypothetical protein